jgi:hypothetical protein
MKMVLKPRSIFAGFSASALVVIYIVIAQFSEQSNPELVINPIASSAHDCANEALTNPYANPYAQSEPNCKNKPATLSSPIVSNSSDAATVGKNLRELAHCNNTNAGCQAAAPVQAKLIGKLEDMSGKGNPQAHYELALQLQRQEQGVDSKMPTADEIANNRNLQRSIALLAEAIAAGNEDAQKLRDSMGDQARLLHTGR